LAGEIEGRVLFKNEPDSSGVVKLFEVLPDSTISVKADMESRIAFAARDGGFRFSALPTDGSRFIVWAFKDKNNDGRFADGKEFSALYPDTVTLTASRPRADQIFINIIDPNEPGVISGTISDATDMRLPATVRFEPLLPGEKALVIRADSTGRYLAPKLPPGRYLVSVFIDIAADSLCGEYASPEDSTIMLKEPCFLVPDTLIVEPGAEMTLDPVILEKRDEE
jgi:hypothetical protein